MYHIDFQNKGKNLSLIYNRPGIPTLFNNGDGVDCGLVFDNSMVPTVDVFVELITDDGKSVVHEKQNSEDSSFPKILKMSEIDQQNEFHFELPKKLRGCQGTATFFMLKVSFIIGDLKYVLLSCPFLSVQRYTPNKDEQPSTRPTCSPFQMSSFTTYSDYFDGKVFNCNVSILGETVTAPRPLTMFAFEDLDCDNKHYYFFNFNTFLKDIKWDSNTGQPIDRPESFHTNEKRRNAQLKKNGAPLPNPTITSAMLGTIKPNKGAHVWCPVATRETNLCIAQLIVSQALDLMKPEVIISHLADDYFLQYGDILQPYIHEERQRQCAPVSDDQHKSLLPRLESLTPLSHLSSCTSNLSLLDSPSSRQNGTKSTKVAKMFETVEHPQISGSYVQTESIIKALLPQAPRDWNHPSQNEAQSFSTHVPQVHAVPVTQDFGVESSRGSPSSKRARGGSTCTNKIENFSEAREHEITRRTSLEVSQSTSKGRRNTADAATVQEAHAVANGFTWLLAAAEEDTENLEQSSQTSLKHKQPRHGLEKPQQAAVEPAEQESGAPMECENDAPFYEPALGAVLNAADATMKFAAQMFT